MSDLTTEDLRYSSLADYETKQLSAQEPIVRDEMYSLRFGRRRSTSSWATLRLIAEATLVAFAVMLFIGAQRQQKADCQFLPSASLPGLEVTRKVVVTAASRRAEREIYQGPPTAVREKAWTSLWDDIIPGPQPHADAAQAMPAVFHHLFCLDVIRQYTWHQIGYYGEDVHTFRGGAKVLPLVPVPETFRNSSDVQARVQVDDCIEVLREALLCNADTTGLPIVDNAVTGERNLDLESPRQCAVWEHIRGAMSASVVATSVVQE